MTREERNNKLKYLITCMKCEVSGKCCDENCPTQYDAGNMGEIIENLEKISKILEQQPCEDTISRQAAIDAINSHFGFNTEEEYGSAVQEVINGLPPAQPEIIRCKDCRYYRWESDMCDYPYATAQNVVHEDDFCSNAERRTDE